MGVYSNTQIRQAIADDHIVCYPFNDKHISHASLDVTLGYYYYRIEPSNERTIYNPFDREDVERYFDGAFKAQPHREWCDMNGFKPIVGIPDDHPVIALKPGERILAHTHEFFGIRPPGACEIKSRLTLEIYNLNHRETVILPVGERIAQAVFHETGEVMGDYGSGRDEGFSGKYQQGTDLDTLIKTWSPSLMLPMAWKDKRSLPVKIEGMFYD
jgi:deoxycytidine triphosphate deaminase